MTELEKALALENDFIAAKAEFEKEIGVAFATAAHRGARGDILGAKAALDDVIDLEKYMPLLKKGLAVAAATVDKAAKS